MRTRGSDSSVSDGQRTSSVTDRSVLPYRIHSQPGTDEHQGKHDEQDVAESLALGVVGHFSSLQTQTCCMIYINMTCK